jgi:hypothetical protein
VVSFSPFTPEERASVIHWVGGCVGPRAGLDDVEKRKLLTLPGIKPRLLGRPAHNQILYRLSYPGSFSELVKKITVISCIAYPEAKISR